VAFLLDLRAEALRPPRLRPDDAFRRADFLPPALRALLARFRVERLRAPPLLRPEDPDRDLFLPLLDLLDFLAAAMGRLRVGGFVERIARFAHNNVKTHSTTLHCYRLAFARLSESARFAMLHDPEVFVRQSSCPPLVSHARWRLVHRFVGQLERTPVGSGDDEPLAFLCFFQLSERLHGIFRIHVNGTHEPTWLVSSDRQNRDIYRPAPGSNGAEFRM